MTKTGLNLENNYILDFGKFLSWAKQGSLHKCPWFEIRAPSFRPHPMDTIRSRGNWRSPTREVFLPSDRTQGELGKCTWE